jgi:hypothetical protein
MAETEDKNRTKGPSKQTVLGWKNLQSFMRTQHWPQYSPNFVFKEMVPSEQCYIKQMMFTHTPRQSKH